MANLDTVQVRTQVDETDIGKVQPGLQATITVDAYPNRPFEGAVLKIEPQATVQQNVTMFPVLVRIANPNHLLKPGMNTEVEIHVGRRENVIAIPNAALRTQRDVASAAQVLGLDPAQVQQDLASVSQPAVSRDSASLGGTQARPDSAAAKAPAGGNTMTTPDGRTIQLPAGVTEAQVRSAFQKRMSGQPLSRDEETAMRAMRAAFQRAGGGAGGGGGPGGGGFRRAQGGDISSFIVFVLRKGQPTAVTVRTGLTDLDYIEVVSGLTEQDTVLVLPSASLLNAQRDMRERTQRMTGGGLPGLQQQTPTTGGGQRPQAQTRP
jgi:HlyD family secretion protein